jgi:glycosyltransferase involved in cell wall biosynthesis
MGAWTRLELLPNPLPSGVGLTDDNGGLVRTREILAVARLVPQKGLDVLLHSFAQLPQAVRAGWRVTLVGDGPERDRLERMAQTLGLADVVVFEGFRSDPLAFMQRASIFALPSRFEGMPNALLEAMAAGLPSVVTNASPGPLEMVTDQIHGLVVPRNNPSCFAEALQCLIQSPELRRRYGEAAQAKLRSLDWSVVEPHWRSVLALPNR